MSDATHDSHASKLSTLTSPDVALVRKASFIAAIGGVGAFVVLSAINFGVAENGLQDVFFAYLCGFVFTASPAFGSIMLSMVAYITSASWGVVFRRLFQAYMRTLPVVFLLFLPIAVCLFLNGGKASPFWWADTSWTTGTVDEIAAAKEMRYEAVEESQHKIHDYLNPMFFIARTVGYFAICGAFVYLLNKFARPAEDQNDAYSKGAIRNVSGPGIVVFVLCMTAASTDWVMSVEPTWASSMFPIVFGMNMFLTTFALSSIIFYSINANKPDVLAIVKDKFRIDIGTLTLGFTMVWAYASFSQYMLIWAGNLPEEISYFRKRGDHGWEYLAYYLIAFHWLVPFVTLLFREVKTCPTRMRIMCVLLLSVCVADVIWWILPAVPREHGMLHVPMALAAIVGVFGIWGLEMARQLAKRPILPANSEGQFLENWGHH